MSAAEYLIDTIALAHMLRGDAQQYGWDQAAAAGLIPTRPVTDSGTALKPANEPRASAGRSEEAAIIGLAA